MAKGYAGRYLQVDLKEGRCSDFTIDDSLLRQFIGGSALGAKLYFDGILSPPILSLRRVRCS